jgi:hypothetical protein
MWQKLPIFGASEGDDQARKDKLFGKVVADFLNV